MEDIVYLKGSLVPRSGAYLSISDHGLLYGYGLFETMRAYHGRIFLLERHVKRLNDAAGAIGLVEKLAGLDLARASRETVTANNLQDARVRLTVTSGESDAMPWADAGGAPTLLVTARPYTPLAPEVYEKGYRVGIASVRRTRQSVLSSVKSINYLLNVVARMEAAAKGLDEALLLNDEGYIAEGGSSNVFFVRDSKLVTPSLNSGIIPGVTRAAVLELARNIGTGASEGPLGVGIIKSCDEAFMTNAMIEIMPVTVVADAEGKTATIGDGRPGPVTRRLMAAYREKVERETG